MKMRSGSQLVVDVMPELEDASDALLIVVHKDDTVSWHSMNDRLHSKLGMLHYVKLLIEQAILKLDDVDDEPQKQAVN